MTTTAPQTAPQTTGASRTPNVFHLRGRAVHITYYPGGEGPLTPDGPIRLVYQHSHQAKTFRTLEIAVQEVANLGTIVTALLHATPDVGSTTISLLVPTVLLGTASSVPVHTMLITTMHSSTVAGPVEPQPDSYTVTNLSGTASVQILPL